jgi:hypothetical protein
MGIKLHLAGDGRSPAERRRDARLEVTRPVKLQCPETGRYWAGRTCNVSPGGAMVEVAHPSLLVPGQAVKLGVAWTNRQTLLNANDLVDATVVRSLGEGAVQYVAVSFAHRLPLAAAI